MTGGQIAGANQTTGSIASKQKSGSKQGKNKAQFREF
tara:strand:- start:255 stop:365 length:111 start_codon:yes stop_codon:yes gene_type:complete